MTHTDSGRTVTRLAGGAELPAPGRWQIDPGHTELVARLLAAEAGHEALLGVLREPKDVDRATPYAFVEGIG